MFENWFGTKKSEVKKKVEVDPKLTNISKVDQAGGMVESQSAIKRKEAIQGLSSLDTTQKELSNLNKELKAALPGVPDANREEVIQAIINYYGSGDAKSQFNQAKGATEAGKAMGKMANISPEILDGLGLRMEIQEYLEGVDLSKIDYDKAKELLFKNLEYNNLQTREKGDRAGAEMRVKNAVDDRSEN